jgi:hypothetical protein
MESAWTTNLMEQRRAEMNVSDGAVEWSLGPFSVETICVKPSEPDRAAMAETFVGIELGPEAEPVQPVWCRYWQHNVGAHPIGYLPVGIYLEGGLPVETRGGNFPTIGRMRVTVNNNLTDKTISGVAHLAIPMHWTAVPSEIPYDLGPREHVTVDVTVAAEKQIRTGLIKAQMEFDGQIYQDVIEAGRNTEFRVGGGGSVRRNRMNIIKEREPEWEVFREADDILVRVRNPWFEPLDVQLTIISPLETWGAVAGRYGLANVTPTTRGLVISGRRTEIVRFGMVGSNRELPEFWAWAKLACNGKPEYKPVPGTTA